MWLLWLLLIVVGLYIVKGMVAGKSNQLNNGSADYQQNETDLSIIKKRLASGEIDEDEYNRLRQILDE